MNCNFNINNDTTGLKERLIEFAKSYMDDFDINLFSSKNRSAEEEEKFERQIKVLRFFIVELTNENEQDPNNTAMLEVRGKSLGYDESPINISGPMKSVTNSAASPGHKKVYSDFFAKVNVTKHKGVLIKVKGDVWNEDKRYQLSPDDKGSEGVVMIIVPININTSNKSRGDLVEESMKAGFYKDTKEGKRVFGFPIEGETGEKDVSKWSYFSRGQEKKNPGGKERMDRRINILAFNAFKNDDKSDKKKYLDLIGTEKDGKLITLSDILEEHYVARAKEDLLKQAEYLLEIREYIKEDKIGFFEVKLKKHKPVEILIDLVSLKNISYNFNDNRSYWPAIEYSGEVYDYIPKRFNDEELAFIAAFFRKLAGSTIKINSKEHKFLLFIFGENYPNRQGFVLTKGSNNELLIKARMPYTQKDQGGKFYNLTSQNNGYNVDLIIKFLNTNHHNYFNRRVYNKSKGHAKQNSDGTFENEIVGEFMALSNSNTFSEYRVNNGSLRAYSKSEGRPSKTMMNPVISFKGQGSLKDVSERHDKSQSSQKVLSSIHDVVKTIVGYGIENFNLESLLESFKNDRKPVITVGDRTIRILFDVTESSTVYDPANGTITFPIGIDRMDLRSVYEGEFIHEIMHVLVHDWLSNKDNESDPVYKALEKILKFVLTNKDKIQSELKKKGYVGIALADGLFNDTHLGSSDKAMAIEELLVAIGYKEIAEVFDSLPFDRSTVYKGRALTESIRSLFKQLWDKVLTALGFSASDSKTLARELLSLFNYVQSSKLGQPVTEKETTTTTTGVEAVVERLEADTTTTPVTVRKESSAQEIAEIKDELKRLKWVAADKQYTGTPEEMAEIARQIEEKEKALTELGVNKPTSVSPRPRIRGMIVGLPQRKKRRGMTTVSLDHRIRTDVDFVNKAFFNFFLNLRGYENAKDNIREEDKAGVIAGIGAAIGYTQDRDKIEDIFQADIFDRRKSIRNFIKVMEIIGAFDDGSLDSFFADLFDMTTADIEELRYKYYGGILRYWGDKNFNKSEAIINTIKNDGDGVSEVTQQIQQYGDNSDRVMSPTLNFLLTGVSYVSSKFPDGNARKVNTILTRVFSDLNDPKDFRRALLDEVLYFLDDFSSRLYFMKDRGSSLETIVNKFAEMYKERMPIFMLLRMVEPEIFSGIDSLYFKGDIKSIEDSINKDYLPMIEERKESEPDEATSAVLKLLYQEFMSHDNGGNVISLKDGEDQGHSSYNISVYNKYKNVSLHLVSLLKDVVGAEEVDSNDYLHTIFMLEHLVRGVNVVDFKTALEKYLPGEEGKKKAEKLLAEYIKYVDNFTQIPHVDSVKKFIKKKKIGLITRVRNRGYMFNANVFNYMFRPDDSEHFFVRSEREVGEPEAQLTLSFDKTDTESAYSELFTRLFELLGFTPEMIDGFGLREGGLVYDKLKSNFKEQATGYGLNITDSVLNKHKGLTLISALGHRHFQSSEKYRFGGVLELSEEDLPNIMTTMLSVVFPFHTLGKKEVPDMIIELANHLRLVNPVSKTPDNNLDYNYKNPAKSDRLVRLVNNPYSDEEIAALKDEDGNVDRDSFDGVMDKKTKGVYSSLPEYMRDLVYSNRLVMNLERFTGIRGKKVLSMSKQELFVSDEIMGRENNKVFSFSGATSGTVLTVSFYTKVDGIDGTILVPLQMGRGLDSKYYTPATIGDRDKSITQGVQANYKARIPDNDKADHQLTTDFGFQGVLIDILHDLISLSKGEGHFLDGQVREMYQSFLNDEHMSSDGLESLYKDLNHIYKKNLSIEDGGSKGVVELFHNEEGIRNNAIYNTLVELLVEVVSRDLDYLRSNKLGFAGHTLLYRDNSKLSDNIKRNRKELQVIKPDEIRGIVEDIFNYYLYKKPTTSEEQDEGLADDYADLEFVISSLLTSFRYKSLSHRMLIGTDLGKKRYSFVTSPGIPIDMPLNVAVIEDVVIEQGDVAEEKVKDILKGLEKSDPFFGEVTFEIVTDPEDGTVNVEFSYLGEKISELVNSFRKLRPSDQANPKFKGSLSVSNRYISSKGGQVKDKNRRYKKEKDKNNISSKTVWAIDLWNEVTDAEIEAAVEVVERNGVLVMPDQSGSRSREVKQRWEKVTKAVEKVSGVKSYKDESNNTVYVKNNLPSEEVLVYKTFDSDVYQEVFNQLASVYREYSRLEEAADGQSYMNVNTLREHLNSTQKGGEKIDIVVDYEMAFLDLLREVNRIYDLHLKPEMSDGWTIKREMKAHNYEEVKQLLDFSKCDTCEAKIEKLIKLRESLHRGYAPSIKWHVRGGESVTSQVMIKSHFAPLLPSESILTPMEGLMMDMYKENEEWDQQLSIISYQSAIKEGIKEGSISVNRASESGEVRIADGSVVTLPSESAMEVVYTKPDPHANTSTIGIQFFDHLMNHAREGVLYGPLKDEVDGSDYTALRDLMSTFKEDSDILFLSEFGIRLKDNKFDIHDPLKFAEFVRDNLEDLRKGGEVYIDDLSRFLNGVITGTVKKEDFINFVNTHPTLFGNVVRAAHKIYYNKVKFPGMYQTVESGVNRGFDLKGYRVENGQLKKAEAVVGMTGEWLNLLNHWAVRDRVRDNYGDKDSYSLAELTMALNELIAEGRIDESLITFLSSRIPLTGLNLMDTFVVKQFTIGGQSSAIYIPHDMLVKVGEDHDDDKRYSIFPAIDSNGFRLVSKTEKPNYKDVVEELFDFEYRELVFNKASLLSVYKVLNSYIPRGKAELDMKLSDKLLDSLVEFVRGNSNVTDELSFITELENSTLFSGRFSLVSEANLRSLYGVLNSIINYKDQKVVGHIIRNIRDRTNILRELSDYSRYYVNDLISLTSNVILREDNKLSLNVPLAYNPIDSVLKEVNRDKDDAGVSPVHLTGFLKMVEEFLQTGRNAVGPSVKGATNSIESALSGVTIKLNFGNFKFLQFPFSKEANNLLSGDSYTPSHNPLYITFLNALSQQVLDPNGQLAKAGFEKTSLTVLLGLLSRFEIKPSVEMVQFFTDPSIRSYIRRKGEGGNPSHNLLKEMIEDKEGERSYIFSSLLESRDNSSSFFNLLSGVVLSRTKRNEAFYLTKGEKGKVRSIIKAIEKQWDSVENTDEFISILLKKDRTEEENKIYNGVMRGDFTKSQQETFLASALFHILTGADLGNLGNDELLNSFYKTELFKVYESVNSRFFELSKLTSVDRESPSSKAEIIFLEELKSKLSFYFDIKNLSTDRPNFFRDSTDSTSTLLELVDRVGFDDLIGSFGYYIMGRMLDNRSSSDLETGVMKGVSDRIRSQFLEYIYKGHTTSGKELSDAYSANPKKYFNSVRKFKTYLRETKLEGLASRLNINQLTSPYPFRKSVTPELAKVGHDAFDKTYLSELKSAMMEFKEENEEDYYHMLQLAYLQTGGFTFDNKFITLFDVADVLALEKDVWEVIGNYLQKEKEALGEMKRLNVLYDSTVFPDRMAFNRTRRKASLATVFIGGELDANKRSESNHYLHQAKNQGIPTNEEIKKEDINKNTIAFVSIGDISYDEKGINFVTKIKTYIDLVIDNGGKVVFSFDKDVSTEAEVTAVTKDLLHHYNSEIKSGPLYENGSDITYIGDEINTSVSHWWKMVMEFEDRYMESFDNILDLYPYSDKKGLKPMGIPKYIDGMYDSVNRKLSVKYSELFRLSLPVRSFFINIKGGLYESYFNRQVEKNVQIYKADGTLVKDVEDWNAYLISVANNLSYLSNKVVYTVGEGRRKVTFKDMMADFAKSMRGEDYFKDHEPSEFMKTSPGRDSLADALTSLVSYGLVDYMESFQAVNRETNFIIEAAAGSVEDWVEQYNLLRNSIDEDLEHKLKDNRFGLQVQYYEAYEKFVHLSRNIYESLPDGSRGPSLASKITIDLGLDEDPDAIDFGYDVGDIYEEDIYEEGFGDDVPQGMISHTEMFKFYSTHPELVSVLEQLGYDQGAFFEFLREENLHSKTTEFSKSDLVNIFVRHWLVHKRGESLESHTVPVNKVVRLWSEVDKTEAGINTGNFVRSSLTEVNGDESDIGIVYYQDTAYLQLVMDREGAEKVLPLLNHEDKVIEKSSKSFYIYLPISNATWTLVPGIKDVVTMYGTISTDKGLVTFDEAVTMKHDKLFVLSPGIIDRLQYLEYSDKEKLKNLNYKNASAYDIVSYIVSLQRARKGENVSPQLLVELEEKFSDSKQNCS